MIDYQLLAKQENPFEGLSEVDAEKMKVYLNLFAIPRMNDDEIFQRYGFISQISSPGELLQLASVVALELNQQSVTATPAPKSFTPNTPHLPKEDPNPSSSDSPRTTWDDFIIALFGLIFVIFIWIVLPCLAHC